MEVIARSVVQVAISLISVIVVIRRMVQLVVRIVSIISLAVVQAKVFVVRVEAENIWIVVAKAMNQIRRERVVLQQRVLDLQPQIAVMLRTNLNVKLVSQARRQNINLFV